MTAVHPPLRLGTRASPLAVAQARLVVSALKAAIGLAEEDIQIVRVETVGDRVLDRPLAEIGGKALWTKELDRALLHKEIDFAVHSMKDVETNLPGGIALAGVLERADPRDRLVGVGGVAELPVGAVVGTSSPRRAAQLLNRRPDVQIISLRGNVDSRLRQIAEGKAAATFLAAAGLDRLGRVAGTPLEILDWLPAAAQGIVGMTCRADDERTLALMRRITNADSLACLLAERAVLEGLGGSCHTAVAAHATVEIPEGRSLTLKAELLSPDGRDRVDAGLTAGGDPRALGLELARRLLASATPAILASLEAARAA